MDWKETTSRFESLEVWKESWELRKEISKLVKIFPSAENFILSDQMIRASRPVSVNIAEGHGRYITRYHFQENIQFCRQSRGSLYELLDHLTVAFDEHYIQKIDESCTQVTILTKLLNGMFKIGHWH